jgi:hypothetical protein
MLKAAVLLGLLAVASAADLKVELCVYPYDISWDKSEKCLTSAPFVMYERYGSGNKRNFWYPYSSKYDEDKNTFSGPRGIVTMDEDSELIKEVILKGNLKIGKNSREYKEYMDDILELDIKSYDAVDYEQCACPKQEQFVKSLTKKEPKCDYDEDTEGLNCPKCECGQCEGDNYKYWSYFKKTVGTIKNLKGKECKVVARKGEKLGFTAQAGSLGANAKNKKFGYSFWFECGEEDEYKTSKFDFNFELAECQHASLPEKPELQKEYLKKLVKKAGYDKIFLQEQIMSKLRGN